MNRRLLIVDDSKAVHAFIKEALGGFAAAFVDAFDGDQALTTLQRDRAFDLILLDWEMPNRTGIETLAEIRSRGIATPVVMVTSLNDMMKISEALDKGADDYVMKPFTKDILLDKLADVLARRSA